MKVPALALALLLAGPLAVLADEARDPEASAEAPGLEAPPGADAELDELLEDHLLREGTSTLGDPIEPWNRGVLWVNRSLDTVLFSPITKVYGFLMPDPAKKSVRRFFLNLASPPILVNDLLQGEGKRALVTGTRLVVNTTVGIAGLFDPAAAIGLERHEADFGQTLYLYGVKSGSYLVLPVFGPSTTRDTVGFVVDAVLRPDLWLLGGTQILILGVGDGVSLREVHQEAIEELERESIDFYVALRSVYWMNRVHFLEESRAAREARAQLLAGPPETRN